MRSSFELESSPPIAEQSQRDFVPPLQRSAFRGVQREIALDGGPVVEAEPPRVSVQFARQSVRLERKPKPAARIVVGQAFLTEAAERLAFVDS
jgi:hypothetical protein